MLALPDLGKSLKQLGAHRKTKRARSQENPVWSFNRLFGQCGAKQGSGEVSAEPDASNRGLQKDGQPKSASLRDGASLKQQRLISPRKLEGGDADGASTSADIYEGLSTHRSSTFSDRRRLQAEQEDPSKDCTVHLQYVPFWALLGLVIMLVGCAIFSTASLQAGGSLKQLVALVGGSTSGFTNIIAAYVATFTVTIAVSVICLGLAIAMYSVRTDQKLRRDLRYGDSERSLGVYKVYYWLTATLFVLMFVMAAWFVVLVAVNTTAAQSMSTLINGADAGVAIISSAVAAANATLIRAHQVVGEIDGMASQFAQSPIGSIVGQLNGGNNVLNPYVNSNVSATSVAQQLVNGATAASQLASGNGGDQKQAASTLINTAQKIASQLTPAPTPTPTPQANFLNLPNIGNLQGLLGALPGNQKTPQAQVQAQAQPQAQAQYTAPAAPNNPLANLMHFQEQQPSQQQQEGTSDVPPTTQTQQGAPAPAPKTLGSFAQQVLDALVPNEESILRLAGMAGNGAAAGAGRVPSEGSGADGWQFGSGHNGNSVCPSLACLDVKMYNFLNSEACICTVQDLKSIHNYATDAQGHLKLALIGVVLLYLGAALLTVRLASEATTVYYERHLIWGAKFDRLHERKLLRLQQEEEAELVAQRERELELQEMGKRKLSAQPATDIRVEIPGKREAVAPCAPKTSPMLSPGKASPKEPADAAP